MNPLLIEFLGKGTLLLSAAWCLHFAVRKGNARWRVLIWRMVLPALGLLTVLVVGAPKVGLPVMPVEEVKTAAASVAPVVVDQKAEVSVVPPVKAVPVASELVGTGKVAAPAVAGAPSSPRKPIEWAKILTWIYAVPVFLFLGGLLAAWLKMRGMLRRSFPVEGDAEELFRKVAEDFGVHRAAGARHSREVASPILVGWLRPRLLLPTAIAEAGDARQLRMIFAHEVAHLSTRDALWNLVIRFGQMLLWFHPLAWGMSAAHGRACEEAADGKAAKYAGDVEGYGDTLAGLALRAHAWQLRSTGLPMARAASIPQRLRNLTKNAESRRLARGRVMVFGSLALIAIGIAAIVTLAKRPVDIRGVITDSNGLPIPDAVVKICYATMREGPNFLCPSVYADCGKFATTDASGGFRIRDVDPKLEFIVLTAAPGFDGTFQFKVDAQKGIQRLTLNRWTGKTREGETAIRGRFVDEGGRPIAGALIKAGSGPNEGVAGVSDENGKFGVTWKNSDELTVYASAPGFAPKRMELKTPLPTELEVALERGVRIEGRIVSDGKGLGGVPVYMEDSGYRDLPLEHRSQTKTDSGGRFSFPDVPKGRVVSVYANRSGLSGMLVTDTITIDTGTKSNTLVLKDIEARPALVVRGKVQLPDGAMFPENSMLLISNETQRYNYRLVPLEGDGRFEMPGALGERFSVNVKVAGFALETNALGEPISKFEIEGEGSRIDMKLLSNAEATSRMIEGSVVNLQGIPVVGAKTAIVLLGEEGRVFEGSISSPAYRRQSAKTDDSGEYRLPHVEGKGRIFATSKDGYGEVDLADAESKPIVLKEWGQVVGRYAPGGVALGKRTVGLSFFDGKSDEARVLFTTQKSTDEQGNFAFDRVPQGRLSLHVARDGYHSSIYWTEIDGISGQTTNAKLDGPGCTLVGRIEIPPDVAPLLDYTQNYSKIQMGGNPFNVAYGVSFGPDGRFEIRGMQPGMYSMEINVRWKTKDAYLAAGIAAGKDFKIAEGQRELDLGGIPVVAGIPPLQVGSPAPEFDLVAADGSRVQSKELRGKVLVIQFNSAGWDAENRAKYVDQSFQNVRKAMRGDEQVEYLAFTLGKPEEFPKSLFSSNFWKSCYIGDEENSPLLKAYHLERNMPVEVIVGADGNLAYLGQSFGQAQTVAVAEQGKAVSIQEK